MSELIESIIARNFIDANKLFEDRLDSIVEQKLLEKKQTLGELMGYRGYGAKSGPLAGKSDAEKKAFWKQRIDQRKAEKAHATTVAKPFGSGGKLSKQDIKIRSDAGYKKADDALNPKTKKPTNANDNTAGAKKPQTTTDTIDDIQRDASKMGVSSKKNKTSDSRLLRANALRGMRQQDAQNAANDWAAKRYQKHVDRKTVQSAKNILKGQNVGANARNLLKYGRKSTAAKAAGAAWKGWGNVVSAGMRGPLEESKAPRRIRVRAIKKDK